MGIPTAVDSPDTNPDVNTWCWIAVSQVQRGDITSTLRKMPDNLLKGTAKGIAKNHTVIGNLLEGCDLPPIDGHGFWAGTVLPAIRKELDRRSRPPRPQHE